MRLVLLPSLRLCLLLWLALAALDAGGQPAPAPAEDPEVARFVRAVRYVAIVKAQARVLTAVAPHPSKGDDTKFRAYLKRIAELDEATMLPYFVRAFQRNLDRSDAMALADFFESPVGQKIAAFSIVLIDQRGEDAAAARQALRFTDQESEAASRFMKTEVYLRYSRLAASDALQADLTRELSRAPEFADLKLDGVF